MPDGRRVTCQICKRHRDECGEISWRGKCSACAKRIESDASDDLHYHRGEVFQRWRRAVAAGVGGVLIDDLERR